MKKIISLALAVVMMLALASCTKDDKEWSFEEATNTKSDGFYVDGTKLYDANGNEFVMRGVNHAHAWFREDSDTALEAIAKTGSNTVRIVLASGVQWSGDHISVVKELIEKCKSLGMIAVLEVHDGTGNDEIETLDKIVDYWIKIKDAVIGNEKYVIVNIANEWVGKWGDKKLWRDGYLKAIPRLREAGIKNTLMVDSAGWGQYAESIHDYGKDVFEADPDKNTMFSIHMYGAAGKNEQVVKSNIDKTLDENLCVIVGEFGYKHSDGDVDEATIMSYSEEKQIGYLGWSWKGNGGGVEYLDIALDWEGTQLSPDWGEVLINGENGIKATSKRCTIFDVE